MGTFDSIPEALSYAAFALAGRGHGYVINVRGPKEVAESRAAAVQVVPATFVYRDADLGFTIHMPFDPSSGTFAELVRFLDTQGHELFDEYRQDGILMFAIKLGSDVPRAARVLEYLLEHVHEYPGGTPFRCEVYDEGIVSKRVEGSHPGPTAFTTQGTTTGEPLPLSHIPLPLRMVEGGAVRVGNTRVSLDLLVEQYENGMSPEDMTRAYDTLALADVHAVIAYYLRHRDQVRGYLKRRAGESEALRARIEAGRPSVRREELAARRHATENAHAPAGQ